MAGRGQSRQVTKSDREYAKMRPPVPTAETRYVPKARGYVTPSSAMENGGSIRQTIVISTTRWRQSAAVHHRKRWTVLCGTCLSAIAGELPGSFNHPDGVISEKRYFSTRFLGSDTGLPRDCSVTNKTGNDSDSCQNRTRNGEGGTSVAHDSHCVHSSQV
jgi:hypothetical protein